MGPTSPVAAVDAHRPASPARARRRPCDRVLPGRLLRGAPRSVLGRRGLRSRAAVQRGVRAGHATGPKPLGPDERRHPRGPPLVSVELPAGEGLGGLSTSLAYSDERRLQTAEYILDKHHEVMARAPALRQTYLRVAGVAAARLGEFTRARGDFTSAWRASRATCVNCCGGRHCDTRPALATLAFDRLSGGLMPRRSRWPHASSARARRAHTGRPRRTPGLRSRNRG